MKNAASAQKKGQKQKRYPFRAFLQLAFLTTKNFLGNRLLSYAGACSFSFLFSFIPVFMLIAVFLLRILHASSESIVSMLNGLPELQEYINVDTAIKIARHSGTSASFEILLGFFIFWMARRFFATVFDSIQSIFHTKQQNKALIQQILTLAVEVAVVVLAAAVIFAYVSLRTVIILPTFASISQHFPQATAFLSQQYLLQLPNLLLFLLTAVLYRIGSGTKPSVRLCLLAALLCTGAFWIFRHLLHLFLNTANYNLIYGVFGHLVVLLLDIYFFFVIFLVCAQLIFCIQFFDELALGELYLIPRRGDGKGKTDALRRTLFTQTGFHFTRHIQLMKVANGSVIYKPGDKPEYAYYLASGFVQHKAPDLPGEPMTYMPGEFFGELGCMLQKPRSGLASAVTDAEIICIAGEEFKKLLSQNPQAAQKALTQINAYFAEVYGRNSAF